MEVNKLYTRQEIKQYKKSGDWNKFIYINAILNAKSNKIIHKKIKKDAQFYQKKI